MNQERRITLPPCALLYVTSGCSKRALYDPALGDRPERFNSRCMGLAMEAIIRLHSTGHDGGDTTGMRSIMAMFATADAAVRCAIEIQRATNLLREELALQTNCGAKVGLSHGEVFRMGDDATIFGSHPLLASSLEARANRGTILASGHLVAQVGPDLQSRCSHFDPGEVKVRFRQFPFESWQIDWT